LTVELIQSFVHKNGLVKTFSKVLSMHIISLMYVAIIGTYSNTYNITMISDVLKFNLICFV